MRVLWLVCKEAARAEGSDVEIAECMPDKMDGSSEALSAPGMRVAAKSLGVVVRC